jgi:hypothetical protein
MPGIDMLPAGDDLMNDKKTASPFAILDGVVFAESLEQRASNKPAAVQEIFAGTLKILQARCHHFTPGYTGTGFDLFRVQSLTTNQNTKRRV